MHRLRLMASGFHALLHVMSDVWCDLSSEGPRKGGLYSVWRTSETIWSREFPLRFCCQRLEWSKFLESSRRLLSVWELPLRKNKIPADLWVLKSLSRTNDLRIQKLDPTHQQNPEVSFYVYPVFFSFFFSRDHSILFPLHNYVSLYYNPQYIGE